MQQQPSVYLRFKTKYCYSSRVAYILFYRAIRAKIEVMALMNRDEIQKHKLECLYRYLRNLSKTSKSDLDRFFERNVKIHGQDATEKLKQDAREYYKKNKMA